MTKSNLSTTVATSWVGIVSTIVTTSVAGIIASIQQTPSMDDDIMLYTIAIGASIAATCVYYVYTATRQRIQSNADIDRSEYKVLEDGINQIDSKLNAISTNVTLLTDVVVSSQRSDLIHRATKYIYDRRNNTGDSWITIEERNAWLADYRKYEALAEVYNIDNHYLASLRDRIENLPGKNL